MHIPKFRVILKEVQHERHELRSSKDLEGGMEGGPGMAKSRLPSSPIKEFQTRQNVTAMGKHVKDEPLRKREAKAAESGVDVVRREIGEDSENLVHKEGTLGGLKPLFEGENDIFGLQSSDSAQNDVVTAVEMVVMRGGCVGRGRDRRGGKRDT